MPKKSDEYGPKESEARMKAALLGARIAGHKTMADIKKKSAAKKKSKREKARKP